MKYNLLRSGAGARLVVARPVTSHITKESLEGLLQKSQLLCLYKRLYKLRHFIGDTEGQKNGYCNLLRRKIRYLDVNLRREKLMGLLSPVSGPVLAERMANTYAFVFNATCAAETDAEVTFYDDLKKALQERPENGVLKTMVEMEKACPAQIKYDRRLSWVGETRAFYEQAGGSQRDINRLHALKRAHFVGYLQYEQSLMNMNESCKMCL